MNGNFAECYRTLSLTNDARCMVVVVVRCGSCASKLLGETVNRHSVAHMKGVNMQRLGFVLMISLLAIACGDDSDGSGSSNSADNGSSCFTSDECSEAQYCRAVDPSASPEGSCEALEPEGGSCTLGSQCTTELFCLKTRGQSSGVCTSLPTDCGELDYCNCALTLCEGSLGSCSPSDLDDVENSSLVSCQP